MMQTNLLHSILDGESKLFSLLQKEKKVFGVKEKTFSFSSSLYRLYQNERNEIQHSVGQRGNYSVLSVIKQSYYIHDIQQAYNSYNSQKTIKTTVADWALSP